MDELERQKMLREQEAEPERIISSRAGLPCQDCATLTTERDRLREQVEDCIRAWLALNDMANSPVYRDMLAAADAVLIKVVDWYAEQYPDAAPIRQRHLEALAGTGETP